MISEDDALEKANQLHPELQHWQEKDFQKAEIREGVNWRLHLQMDAVVLRRESDASLPDGAVINKLQKQGVGRAEAIHRISRLVVEDLWHRMKGPPTPPDNSHLAPQAMDEWTAERNRILDQRIEELADS